MGYTVGNWQRLEQDIREQHLTQNAQVGKVRRSGQNTKSQLHCAAQIETFAKSQRLG